MSGYYSVDIDKLLESYDLEFAYETDDDQHMVDAITVNYNFGSNNALITSVAEEIAVEKNKKRILKFLP